MSQKAIATALTILALGLTGCQKSMDPQAAQTPSRTQERGQQTAQTPSVTQEGGQKAGLEHAFEGSDGTKKPYVKARYPDPNPSPKAPIILGNPPFDFSDHEWANFSQSGEDGVLEAIFQVIEPTNKFVVEFGASEGIELSNARHLIINRGWSGLLLEGDEAMAEKLVKNYAEFPKVKAAQAWIYPGNVETLFRQYGVPKDLDLLSIDIDSNDYYVWKVLHEFRPKVLVVEYNASYPPPEKMVVEFSPFNFWDGSDYYGASLQSLKNLGQEKGYELIYCTNLGANAIFVDKKYFARFKISDNSAEALYKLPLYGVIDGGRAPNGLGHPSSEIKVLKYGSFVRLFEDTMDWDAMKIPKKRRNDL